MRVAGLIAVSGCAALALLSCAALLGLEPLSDREAEDANVTPTVDASAIDASAPDSSCEPLRLPARPGSEDGGSAGPSLELTFALDGLSLSPEVGLNLDSRCTALDVESSCALPAVPGAAVEKPWADGPGGADVTANKLVEVVGRLVPSFSERSIANGVAYGFSNLLIRVQDWNGAANDEYVSVTVYASRGLQSETERTVDRRAPNPENTTERWTYVAKSAGVGYVSDHWLVVKLFNEPLPFVIATQIVRQTQDAGPDELPAPGLRLDADAGVVGSDDERPLTIQLQDALLLANLSETDAGARRLDRGVLAGRVSALDFFQEAARIRNVSQLNPQPFCVNGQATVNLLHRELCGARDIRARQRDDGTGACDALSAALSFSARAAGIGEQVLPPSGDDPCPLFGGNTTCEGDSPKTDAGGQ